MELDIYYYLGLKNTMPFSIGLDLISQKSGIKYIFSHNYEYDSLPLEKTLTLPNVIIFIKSVFKKKQNHYYYNIFLENNFLISYLKKAITNKFLSKL